MVSGPVEVSSPIVVSYSGVGPYSGVQGSTHTNACLGELKLEAPSNGGTQTKKVSWLVVCKNYRNTYLLSEHGTEHSGDT